LVLLSSPGMLAATALSLGIEDLKSDKEGKDREKWGKMDVIEYFEKRFTDTKSGEEVRARARSEATSGRRLIIVVALDSPPLSPAPSRPSLPRIQPLTPASFSLSQITKFNNDLKTKIEIGRNLRESSSEYNCALAPLDMAVVKGV